MRRRSAAVEQTRRRIVDATRELHVLQGIAGTSWDDIAARAGVGVGTVYRHFPSLDELVPACGRVAMDIVALPGADDVGRLFDGLTEPEARVERLVAEAYAIYERGSTELRVALREPDVHRSVAQVAADLDASLWTLVDEALEPLGAAAADRRAVRAMLDLGTWQALQDQGLDGREKVDAVSGMLVARLLRPRAS